MSEDNTLLNNNPSDGDPSPGDSQPTFLWADGLAGEGDVPEWYKADKYKSVSDQAKAYNELEKRFGGFTGAPESYELPEGADTEDTFVQLLSEIGTGANMNQETFSKVYELGEQLLEANAGINKEKEMESLGDNAQERIANVDSFLKSNLSDDYERLMGAVNSAASIELIEKLIAKTAPAKLPVGNAVPVNVPTQNDIDEAMRKTDENGKLLYHSSEPYREKVRGMMARMHGKDIFTYQG